MEPIDVDKTAARSSGAPEAGGAVTPGSRFGGDTLEAKFLRMVARVARDFEAGAYRRLRDLEKQYEETCGPGPGAPHRVRKAFHSSDEKVPIH
jgi:hypothetical protein